jgi:hypothetical protein
MAPSLAGSDLIDSQSRPAAIRLRSFFCRAYMPLVGPSRPGAWTGPINSTGMLPSRCETCGAVVNRLTTGSFVK